MMANNKWHVVITLACLLSRVHEAVSAGRPPSRMLQGDDDNAFEYEASTDVSFFLNLAYDAADMRSDDGDMDDKIDIYYNGRHAFVEDEEDGNKTNISFAGLSLGSIQVMSEDPLYNVYRHAFYQLGLSSENDVEGNFDGHPVTEYGNTLVMDLFELNSTRSETEGALIINVWMAIAHEFTNLQRECGSNDGTADKMNRALDRAAALWIGADQVRGDNIQGHLLYNLAEQAGELFDQDVGETWVNSQLMDLINTMQQDIQSNSCASSDGYVKMRNQVKQAISYMTVPLVQMLIHHIAQIRNEGGSDMVELYALSILPRVAPCDPDAYTDMLQLMVFESLEVEDQQDALDYVQRIYSCLDITCSDVGSYEGSIAQCDDNPPPAPMAGYTPRTDVRGQSYIDRDIKLIRILMFFNVYEAVKDVYQYDGLHALATNQDSPFQSDQFQLFNSYYNTNNFEFADNMINNVLDLTQPFDSASEEQRAEIVIELLRGMVMYLATVSRLENAVHECEQTPATAMEMWDAGAAFYIGSIEGTAAGGQNGGEFLYGMAKQFCGPFGTCEPGGSAVVNNVMLQALDFGGEALSNGECEQAGTVLRSSIQPALYIPLIQGILLSAQACDGISANSQDACMGALYAFSRALLPPMDEASEPSAEALNEASNFQPLSNPLPNGLNGMFGLFRAALPHLSTDCRDIGSLGANGDLCEGETAPPPAPDTPTPTHAPVPHVAAPESDPADLAWGRYIFTDLDAVERGSSLTLDIRDMRNANDLSAATDVYTNGRNANTGLEGLEDWTTLEALSTRASEVMSEDPLYNFYRYALYEEETFEDSAGESWPYADMVVKLALNVDNGNDQQLAAETTIVMNLWMLIANRIYSAVSLCHQQQNPVSVIDAALALWIGREQVAEAPNSGWSMYSMTQRANHLYGVAQGESQVNTDLIASFNEAKVLGGFCENQANAHLEMRYLANDIIKTMSKPLAQKLLYYISIDNLDYTELYALALIPQAVSCKTSTYLALKAALVDSFSRDSSMTEEIYGHFGLFFSCLGFTCEDLGDPTNANSQLQDIIGNVCSNMRASGEQTHLAGYEATSDVFEQARIDLDVRQIDILMRTRAYEGARAMYMWGRNSMSSPRTLMSTHDLATDPSRVDVGEAFEVYSTYFESNNYADVIINSVFNRENEWDEASREQLAEGVYRTLQSMVSYMAVLQNLYAALDTCRSSQGGQVMLDTAVAYLVGSLEGPFFGGSPDGVLLYGLAKERCASFGTCEGSGDAAINEKIMFALADMRDDLEVASCDSAASILRDRIASDMAIPLIQSSIYYASTEENSDAGINGGNPDPGLAAGSIFSLAVLPLVEASNAASAQTIAQNLDIANDDPVPEGVGVVTSAFGQALRGMGIDCSLVGTLQSGDVSVCDDYLGNPDSNDAGDADDNEDGNADNNQGGDDGDDQDGNANDNQGGSGEPLTTAPIEDAPIAPLPETPTNLGEDLYVTTTYVQDRADIAKDVRAMEQALYNGHKDFAQILYNEGENSNVYDENGKAISRRSLAGFSTNSTLDMVNEPLFNRFVYALRDENGMYQGRDARVYADSIVQASFEVTGDSATTLPAEAAVALNLWMYLVHKLAETLQNCKNRKMADTGVHAIDVAVAYWIGDGQVAGDSERGHLLYALAETMGEEFSINQSGQSRTNTNIMRLFHQAKIELSFPSACTDDPNTFRRLRDIVDKIITQMTIPLIQGLIHNLRNNDADRVRVYANGFVPMVAACSPEAFDYLHEKLIEGTFNVVEVDSIIDQIRSTFPCFNLQCSDVGVHSTETEASVPCTDPPALNSLAGYRPNSDVKEYAQLDLDILEIDILMQMEAYEAAEELYSYGKHTYTENDNGVPLVSLAQLATASDRTIVPQFDSFVRYFDGDENYADTIIRVALGSKDGEGSSSVHLSQNYEPQDLRVIVVSTCEYLVMFMAALQGFYEAVGECESGDVSSSQSWDRAAAYTIGHLEGTEAGGSDDGRLFYALAKEHCQEFGTCSSGDGESQSVTDRISSLLYTGRGALLSRTCSEVRKATEEIESLLVVPIIQAVLSYTQNRGSSSQRNAGHSDQVQAFVYASAVLPLVEDVNRDAAETIRSNLEVLGNPLQSGASSVASAFARVYPGLGVKCQYLGITHGMDVCVGAGEPMNQNTKIGLIVGVVLCLLAIVASILILRAKRQARKKPEDNPTFVASAGELNHTEDLLAKSGSHKHVASDAQDDNDEATPMVSSDDDLGEKGDIV